MDADATRAGAFDAKKFSHAGYRRLKDALNGRCLCKNELIRRVEVLSKFSWKRRSFSVAHNYLEETEMADGRRKRGKGIAKLTRSSTRLADILSRRLPENVLARNSRIITEKCSRRELARSARTSMQHAIDRKAIRSGLSVVLFITLPGSLLREDLPARLPMESPQRLRYFSLSFSLAPSLYSPYRLLISHSSYPFPPPRQARFSSERRKSRDARFRSKSKSLSTVPNIFTLDVVSTIPGRHRLRVSLDDVEIALLDVAVKQNILS